VGRIEEEDIVREALANALNGSGDAISVDRILEAAFFRKRPMQAGTQPVKQNVVSLSERRDSLLAVGHGGLRR